MIKENVPKQKAKGGMTKPKCEFCGRVHNIKDDYCYPKTGEIKDGNKWESCSELKLSDLYDQIKYNRNLKLEVMISDKEPGFKENCLAANFKQDSNFSMFSKNKTQVKLDQCFKAFSTEEMLSGNDQWYCSKCKEHRDINKKLELYKIPKILMIQIKRF